MSNSSTKLTELLRLFGHSTEDIAASRFLSTIFKLRNPVSVN